MAGSRASPPAGCHRQRRVGSEPTSERVSVTGRRGLALIVLGVVLALAGLACAYVRRELAEPEAFADRTVEALRSDQVREVIAAQITVALLERGSPDLVSSRPLLLTAVEAVLRPTSSPACCAVRRWRRTPY